jgi:hypothetical protein
MNVEEKSTIDLFKDLSNELTSLVHQEVALAKTELGQKTKELVAASGMFGSGAAVGLLGAGALTAAAIAGLAAVVSVWLSALIVGGALVLVAGVLAATGLVKASQGTPPVPEEAIQSTKEDVEWLKTQTKSARR